MSYNLIIIGAGPAGYVAAIRASQLGAKVALIERGELGGVCLNSGCIPTKSLLASAKRYKQCKEADQFGVFLDKDKIEFDMSFAQRRVDEIKNKLSSGIASILKSYKVDIIKGEAKFVGDDLVNVNDKQITAERILIATGSTWIDLPNIKIDGQFVCTSDHALKWNSVPKNLAIIGGGVVGCEFASLFSTLGSSVTIIEAMPSILPSMENSITRLLASSFKKCGITVRTSTIAKEVIVKNGTVELHLDASQPSLTADKLLISIGRRPNTSNLGLETVGVKVNEKGFVLVDECLKSSNEKIYAAGDVIGGAMLAHMASFEAICAVENIFGKKRSYDHNIVPSPVFTIPEIASIGLTSEQLKSRGVPFKTGRFSYLANGRALCDGLLEGHCLVHADSEGKILGVHFFGSGSDLLLSEAALAIKNELTIKAVIETPHSHPTLSEVFSESAADAVGEGIHKVGGRFSPPL